MIKKLLPLLFLMLSAASAFGQSTKPPASPSAAQNDPNLQSAEQCIDRLKAAEAQVESYKRLLADADARDALKDRLIAELTVSRDAYKAEASTRAQVNSGDTADRILAAKVESLLREEIQTMRDDRDRLLDENRRLRSPGFFKTLFDPRTIGAGFVGFGIGRAVPR